MGFPYENLASSPYLVCRAVRFSNLQNSWVQDIATFTIFIFMEESLIFFLHIFISDSVDTLLKFDDDQNSLELIPPK